MAEIRGGNFKASWVASGNLDTHQWKLVSFSGHDVFLATSGVVLAGVLQNKPKDNEHASIISHGFSKIYYGSSMAAGQEVMAGNNGLATIAASGQFVAGVTLTAGDSGQIGELMLNMYRKSLT